MIGVFALDDDNLPYFVQYGEHEHIESFRFTPERYGIVVLADGTEQMFTTQVHHDVFATLTELSRLPVVHMTDDGTPLDTYDVPIKI